MADPESRIHQKAQRQRRTFEHIYCAQCINEYEVDEEWMRTYDLGSLIKSDGSF